MRHNRYIWSISSIYRWLCHVKLAFCTCGYNCGTLMVFILDLYVVCCSFVNLSWFCQQPGVSFGVTWCPLSFSSFGSLSISSSSSWCCCHSGPKKDYFFLWHVVKHVHAVQSSEFKRALTIVKLCAAWKMSDFVVISSSGDCAHSASTSICFFIMVMGIYIHHIFIDHFALNG